LAQDMMSDEESAFHEGFVLAVRAPNGHKPTGHRLVLEGILWIARTGSPSRYLQEESGKWLSVYRQFRCWTLAGLWEQIMDALNDRRLVSDTLQMIDSTVVRAHHRAAVTRGKLRTKVSTAQAFAGPPSRPRYISASTARACP